MGSPRRGQPRVTWAMIRWVTAVRVCGSGVPGMLSMMAVVRRAPARRGRRGRRWLACAACVRAGDKLVKEPRRTGIAGDAAGCDATGSRLAGEPARLVRAVVHRPVV